MFIKKGRLPKKGTMGCIILNNTRYKIIGKHETFEHCGIDYLKCYTEVIIIHDDIDGEIKLQKGTYRYCL